ncbi:MAG: phycobiliprotein lyase [Oscillatoriales cyanobacterium SM2_1_8]|nr:phycobiliprotein lyase [Oscillatoriales cyanobacterium SM2_1_8]
MGVFEFFQRSAGKWRSLRTTHHLAFRRSESGGTEIQIRALMADDPQILDLCRLHQVDPATAVGGAYVTWEGGMAWDREGEQHQGETVFALVPDADDPGQGTLLRSLGYAEITPAVGRYRLAGDRLELATPYQSMKAIEQFWFVNPNLRLRSSTVEWMGGINTASFCTECRIEDADGQPVTAIVEPAAAQTLATFLAA